MSENYDEMMRQALIEARRTVALTAAATAFGGSVFHSVSEVDRGVLELARSFEKYVEKG